MICIRFRSPRVQRDLKTVTPSHHRKSIPQSTIRMLDRPDRQPSHLKHRRLFGINPPEHLPSDDEFHPQIADQFFAPRSATKNNLIALIFTAIRLHDDATGGRAPAFHIFARMSFRPLDLRYPRHLHSAF